MKGVRFNIDNKPPITVEYERERLVYELRDKFIPRLVKYFNKKLEKGEIEDASAPNKYITLILETALKAELSTKELRKIEPYSKKFAFLPYKIQDNSGSMGHAYTNDDSIHDIAFYLIALCKGYKDVVRNYVDRNVVLESRHDYRGDKYIGYDQANAIAEDAAELTKKCIIEFLQELRETGRVMTSAELAESQKTFFDLSKDKSTTLQEDIASDRSSESTAINSETSSTDNIKNNSLSSNIKILSDAIYRITEAANKDYTDTERSSESSEETTNQKSSSVAGVNDDLEFESENDQNSNIAKTTTVDNSQPNTLSDNLLAWIYELPEWLQNQFLNSAPIKTLIESLEQESAIRDAKTIAQDFATKALSIEETIESADVPEYSSCEDARISGAISKDAIDMTMIWKEPSVSGWILPQVDIELGEALASNNGFNGLPGFHGHGIDIF